MKHRIGIYPGTFDPIHPGHVAFARQAMQTCSLDEIVFLIEPNPRDKPNVTDILHRTTLVMQAIQDVPHTRILRLADEQFTVTHTLPKLQSEFGDAHLTLLIGSDVVRTFLNRWLGLGELIKKVAFVIGVRTGDDSLEIKEIMKKIELAYDTKPRYECINAPHADFASSQVRSGAVDLSSLHPAAAAYIRSRELYPSFVQ